MTYQARMYADGGARGNPGPAAGGAVIFKLDEQGNQTERLADVGHYFPHATNNVAEYTGIIIGLKKAHELGLATLDVCLDSELCVKQINGQYKVKNPVLGKLFLEVYNLKQHFRQIAFRHVRRAFNTEADAVVNRTIDANLQM